jgi:hypothetical protein
MCVQLGPHRRNAANPGSRTFALLFGAQDCQMTVRKVNERQYVANMPNVRAPATPSRPAGAIRRSATAQHGRATGLRCALRTQRLLLLRATLK